MKYALHELLRVRKLREENAMNAAIVAHRNEEDAVGQLEERKWELREYVRHRIAKEEQMYCNLLGRSVHNRDLEEVEINVKIMREDEISYHQRILDAEKALDEARRDLEKKREAYRAAMRSRDKLDEHKKAWLEQLNKESERGEEMELDDFHIQHDENETEAECYEHA